ncbi:MAG: hypothetical protein K0Q70_1941, partial [Rhodospirillales bacterium]|nr:hypothetical protein [Rhodospirillales bacterium]
GVLRRPVGSEIIDLEQVVEDDLNKMAI